ncbi:hypothetical protein CC78DRAFT_474207 [Lojkania enalia]|uniref:Lytic polysaccharide monooxygenase n=1 Tax=Lojkania enalia TaxID=147567 RepID=A0A9P4K245_9PLEO|nr:hypothetical protein CC78DRAFT_474207 [Didymosphaeria enalia]
MHSNILALLGLAAIASGHMHLHYPPTLKGDNNPFTQGEADMYLNYPFGCCDQPVEKSQICKGHLDLLDTDEGQPVVTWAPGQNANFSLSGQSIEKTQENVEGGTHWGGSCQCAISVDKGQTFRVVKTWQGACPHREGGIDPENQVFDFQIPSDIPTGNAVFAWGWVNREQEFNMNCASVVIEGDGNETPEPSSQPSTPTKTGYNYQPQPTGNKQYTLEGCTCECPSQTLSEACICSCPSAFKNKRMIERRALSIHKRSLQLAAKMNVPPVRRVEEVAWEDRELMATDIGNFPGARCMPPKHPIELQFTNVSGDVDEGDGEMELAPAICS